MPNDLFAGTAMKVAAGIIAFLLIIIGVLVWRLDAADDRAAERTKEAAVCELKHLHSRNSLRALENEMAQVVADGAARENRLAEAAREQAKRTEVIRDEVVRIVERTPSPSSAPTCRTAEHILKSEKL